jgi:tRNA-dihydrouridine synthase
MQLYFAPMEGITDSIYRRLHHRYFSGIDRYYMPFFSPTMHRCLTPKEERELPVADREPFCAIPQIMTKNAQDFLWAVTQCRDRGYCEVNVNLGCPSGTVVAKGKGAGMLRDPDGLERFLNEIFSETVLPVSIKTRLGLESGEEFPRLLQIFNQYPVKELILHPRVRKDFYKSPVQTQWFEYTVAHTSIPLCYNGDIYSKEDLSNIQKRFPSLNAVMLGRGLIGDPGMLEAGGTKVQTLEAFHNDLLESYALAFGSARNAMFRMKENWHYLMGRFDGGEKLFKQLRKTTDLQDYRRITAEIFHTLPLTALSEPVGI